MKLLSIVSFLVLLLYQAHAQVKLAWDASSAVGVTNYVLYAHTNTITSVSRSEVLVRMGVGTNLTATVDGLKGQWSFAVAAMKNGVESELSNQINIEVPESPTNLRVVIVPYTDTLTNVTELTLKVRVP